MPAGCVRLERLLEHLTLPQLGFAIAIGVVGAHDVERVAVADQVSCAEGDRRGSVSSDAEGLRLITAHNDYTPWLGLSHAPAALPIKMTTFAWLVR